MLFALVGTGDKESSCYSLFLVRGDVDANGMVTDSELWTHLKLEIIIITYSAVVIVIMFMLQNIY